jgi:hypothetical protein
MAALVVSPVVASPSTCNLKRSRDDASDTTFNVHLRSMAGALGDVCVVHSQGARVCSPSLCFLYESGARALPWQNQAKLVVDYTTVLNKEQAKEADKATGALDEEIRRFKIEDVLRDDDTAVLRRGDGAHNILIDTKLIGSKAEPRKTEAIRVTPAKEEPYYLIVVDLATDWDMNTDPTDHAHYRHVAAITADAQVFEHVKTLVDAGGSLVHLNRSMRNLPNEPGVRKSVEILRDTYFALYAEFETEFDEKGALTWRDFWRQKTPAAEGWSNDLDATAMAKPVDVFAPIFVDPDLCLGTLSLQHCSVDA